MKSLLNHFAYSAEIYSRQSSKVHLLNVYYVQDIRKDTKICKTLLKGLSLFRRDGRWTHKYNRSQKKSKWPAVTIQRMDPNLQPEVFRETLLKKHVTEYYSQRDLRKHPFQSCHFTDKKKKETKKEKDKAL